MKLKRVKIKNFKSIKDIEIHFKNNTICLIGKNESGKTNIIEAISYFDYFKPFASSKLKNRNSSSQDVASILGYFEVEDFGKIDNNKINELINLYDETSKESWNKWIADNNNYFTFLRWGDGVDNIEISIFKDRTILLKLFDNLIQGENAKNKAIELFLETFMPIIEIYTDEELKIKPATIQDLEGEDIEFNTLRRLLNIGDCTDFGIFESDDDDEIDRMLLKTSNEVTKVFRSFYRQDQSIEIKVNFRNSKITVSIKDATDAFFGINERSPGFQYFFAFLINKLYQTRNSNKPQIFLLDEPGKQLHPHASRDLLRTFDDFTKNNQIIYTTHNIFLTLRNDLDNLIFTKKDDLKGTILESQARKNKYQIFRKELGVLLNDSFLIGDVNLVVEGDTEHFALRQLISELVAEDEKYAPLEWVNIYDAGGVNEVINAVRYLQSLNLSGIVLLDSDGEADKEFKKEKFKKLIEQKNWDCIRLNDLFGNDNQERAFEDLFPQSEYLKAYNQYYNDFDFDKKFEPIDENQSLNTPITNYLEEAHYLGLFDENNRKKKGISKLNIMRVLLENIKKNEEKEALKKIHKLIDSINSKIRKFKDGNS